MDTSKVIFALREAVQYVTNRSSRLEGKLLITCILIAELVNLTFSYHLHHVDVHLSVGKLRGSRRRENYDIGTGALTNTVDQYLGVIYAEAPVGSLRFRPPHPVMPWGGIQDCTEPGWVCPQKDYYNQTEYEKQSEDCLNLNIYTPIIRDREENQVKYPVMVYIHGGSYEEGAGNRYDGFCLATHGVVVVTINYRLGPLGFLSNGGPELPGNYGFLDQVEALKWIHTHIHHFRGDPNDVTIFGNSAGAASVGLHLISPKSKGLFHAVIIQSGPPLSFWAVYNQTVDHAQFARQVALRVGCQNESMDAIVDCLRRVPYSTFIEKHNYYPRIVPSRLNFKPVIDGDVLPVDPEMALLSGQHYDVPVMIGVMSEEWSRSMGWFFIEIKKNPGMDDTFGDGIDRYTFEKVVDHVITKRFWWPSYVAEVIKHAYTNWTNISHPIQNRVNYVSFMSDLIMVAPSVKTAKILASQGTPVYMYEFTHKSLHADEDWWGSFHTLELDYVFGSAFTGYDIASDNHTTHTEQDAILSRRIMELWSSFAKHKNPTPTGQQQVWQKFNPNRTNYFHITASSSENLNHLRADKMALWNDLIPKLLPLKDVELFGKKLGALPRINYETLSWILLGSCVLFITAFTLVSWKYMAMRRSMSSGENGRYYTNGAPPKAV